MIRASQLGPDGYPISGQKRSFRNRRTRALDVDTWTGLFFVCATAGFLLFGCQDAEPLYASVDAKGRPIHPISHFADGRLRTGEATAFAPTNNPNRKTNQP